MRAVVVVRLDEGVEARLLLQHIRARRFGRLALERQMHAFMATVLLGMAGGNSLEANAEAQPPDGELGQAIEAGRGGKRHAVVGANGEGEPEVFEGALEDRK